MKESIKDKVEASVNKSGYPLELFVTNELEKEFPVVWNNVYYFDFDENVPRTIDVYLPMMEDYRSGAPRFSTQMIVECKKSVKKAWVFFESNSIVQPEFSGQITDFHEIASNDFENGSWLIKYVPNLASRYEDSEGIAVLAHSYDVIPIGTEKYDPDKKNQTKNTLFEAVNQVVKYVSYDMEKRIKNIQKRFLEEGKVYPVFLMYNPVIVFDGNMFGGKLVGDKISLYKTDRVILEYKYQPRYLVNPKTFYIDIVHKDAFEQFVHSIKNEIGDISKQLGSNKSIFSKDAKDLKEIYCDGEVTVF